MKKVFLLGLITLASSGIIYLTLNSKNTNDLISEVCATCTGSSSCNACKNCKYCKHCSQKGGTCGVCK